MKFPNYLKKYTDFLDELITEAKGRSEMHWEGKKRLLCEEENIKKFPLHGFKGIGEQIGNLSTFHIESEKLYSQVQRSFSSSSEERRKKLNNIKDPFPETYLTTVKSYNRNPDVIAEVLFRANGICEKCGKEAPFKRASDGTPYLEVHHKKRLADGGEDTVGNAIAVCPNCHRELHFGYSLNQ